MNSLFSPASASPGDRFVRVAVERAVDRGSDEGLTYALEQDEIEVGERVEVPLGRGDKRAAGIVVRVGGRELLNGLPVEKVKRVLRRTGARLPPPLVELARWMAGYYVAPLGMVLASMLPAAVKHGTGQVRRIRVERAGDEQAAAILASERLTPTVKAAWEGIGALATREFPIEPKVLARRAGARNLGPINRLLGLGLLRRVEVSEVRAADGVWRHYDVEQHVDEGIVPTDAQRRVIDGVKATLGGFAVHLLRGVTGSGKTEVYLRVIEAVLAMGRTAIVLVPEISLTPQTAGRFVRRFGERVAVLHSGLSAAQRHRQWALAAAGDAGVVVGARSAVFAPLANLGLIVVDEEHDSGYKQDQVPRYQGRDVAIKRGQIEGCPVLLASATPSLESWANAGVRGQGSGVSGRDEETKKGRYRLWELTERVGGGRLPEVEVVDLIAERRETARRDREPGRGFPLIGARLGFEMERTLDSGGQVILLLNRRGYASYVCCPDPACGWSMQCEHCDASMVLHRAGAKGARLPAGEVLRCHHCLAEQVVARTCPVCGKRPIPLGMGTQQLEEELRSRFGARLGEHPARAMTRLDSDTMKTARDYFEALARFARGEVKVLLGTQMIAKGLDFPNVRLVGVVNADTALTIPDFRAGERTFQLVSQVAGRAGRGAAGGRVIVQTMNPGEPAIALAARHDYAAFAAAELAVRRAAGLPPVTRMARIVVRDAKMEKARDGAAKVSVALQTAARAEGVGAQIMGPMPCPIARIAGQFRWAVEVIAGRASELHRLLAGLRARGLLISDARTAVDVDPVALM